MSAHLLTDATLLPDDSQDGCAALYQFFARWDYEPDKQKWLTLCLQGLVAAKPPAWRVLELYQRCIDTTMEFYCAETLRSQDGRLLWFTRESLRKQVWSESRWSKERREWLLQLFASANGAESCAYLAGCVLHGWVRAVGRTNAWQEQDEHILRTLEWLIVPDFLLPLLQQRHNLHCLSYDRVLAAYRPLLQPVQFPDNVRMPQLGVDAVHYCRTRASELRPVWEQPLVALEAVRLLREEHDMRDPAAIVASYLTGDDPKIYRPQPNERKRSSSPAEAAAASSAKKAKA